MELLKNVKQQPLLSHSRRHFDVASGREDELFVDWDIKFIRSLNPVKSEPSNNGQKILLFFKAEVFIGPINKIKTNLKK